jgi:hypothetical protein
MKPVSLALLLLGPLSAVADPVWVTGMPGSTDYPLNLVQAGAENGAPNYVCHSAYMDGVHPGKLLDGHCNIEFAGQELVRDTFEILTADSASVSWLQDEGGYATLESMPAGTENGQTLYACRAPVFIDGSDRGIHAGKVVPPNCNIPYGGGAYLAQNFETLVVRFDTPVAARKPAVPAIAPGKAAGRRVTADGRAAQGNSKVTLRARIR